MERTLRALVRSSVIGWTVWALGCGGDPAPAAKPTTADADAGAIRFGDGAGRGGDGGEGSDGQGDGGLGEDTGARSASDASDVGGDGAVDDGVADGADADADADAGADGGDADPWDGWTKPDVEFQALQVVATMPALDGTSTDSKASFSVTFSKDLDHVTVVAYTVHVRGPGGQELAGTFGGSGKTLTWAADKPIAANTRVDVTVTPLVADIEGQTLPTPHVFHFHTPDHPDMGPYEALARRYAPILEVTLSPGGDAAWDLLRSPSVLGWQLAGSSEAAAATPPLARVAWSVVESQSHFFLHYQAFWAKRPAHGGLPAFANDTAIATVIVARFPLERPVGVATWWKRLDDEQQWLWLTDDAAVVPAGAKLGKDALRGTLAAATLFPPSDDGLGCAGPPCVPRRALLRLYGGSHRLCAGVAGEASGPCAWDAATEAGVARIRYLPAAQASEASFAEAKVGAAPPPYAYALEPYGATFFARRTSPWLFGAATDMTFAYKPPAGRPGGDAIMAGSRFLGGAGNDFGRPLHAIRWKPAGNTSYYDMPRGAVAVDPAWALRQRLGGVEAGPVAFDAKAQVGWSLDYCFNPLLGIDLRGSAPCSGSLPPGP